MSTLDGFDLECTIHNLLKASEIIDSSSAQYKSESQTWQAHRNLHPRILARPDSLASLSRLVAYLADTDLDWAVRCQGIGDASAKDVLISLAGFKDFSFDAEDESIIVGGGMTWGEVEEKLEEQVPGYQAVSARCSFVGVGGMILHGGLSWMSSTYGLASDPQNFLDAQVVKLDGSIIWASEEPDLLFALRGGGHEFAIVTAFKLKVRKFSQKIYSGSINYPRSSLPALAKGVAEFAKRMDEWPSTAMYLYNLDLMEGVFIGATAQPGLAIWLFDTGGEEHGREVFKWALEIKGAVDLTKVMNLREVNIYGDSVIAAKGVCSANMSNPTVVGTDMTADLILRAWEWLETTIALEPTKLNIGTFVLLELFQKAVFRSADDSSECAWPHTQNQHLLQLGVGRPDEGDYPTKLDEKALDMLKNAGPMIVGDKFSSADYFVNFLQPWNDYRAVYGDNYERLQAVKKRYDPRGVLVRKNE
ncbi:FAD binding domain-containing protein [Aureobasidium pullulans]|uniref:FAD binding domain-containing protein n=1 Tax=Aureobasidium pullulans TaxID=5580 RepID=A0A4S8SB87_AURPU|nr:FAD binding domain-containing protein [Aureobasidium pullulans]